MAGLLYRRVTQHHLVRGAQTRDRGTQVGSFEAALLPEERRREFAVPPGHWRLPGQPHLDAYVAEVLQAGTWIVFKGLGSWREVVMTSPI